MDLSAAQGKIPLLMLVLFYSIFEMYCLLKNGFVLFSTYFFSYWICCILQCHEEEILFWFSIDILCILLLHQHMPPVDISEPYSSPSCCLVSAKFCLSNSVLWKEWDEGNNKKTPPFAEKSVWSSSWWKPRDFRLADKGLYGSKSHSELQCNEGMQVNYPSVCVSIAVNYSIHRWQLIGVEWK